VSSTPPNDTAPDGAPVGSSAETAHKQKRPIVWMIIAGVAILAAIGLGIWALKVNSDLNSTQSDLEAAEAQVAAQTEAATAAANELEKINSDNEIYVVSNEDVAAAEKAVADANAAVAEANANVSAAQDEASKLRAELEQARAERELARAERQQSRICARGSLGVLSKIGENEPEAASSELETVSNACTATVSG
jgi:multidrug resistance efflux pump